MVSRACLKFNFHNFHSQDEKAGETRILFYCSNFPKTTINKTIKFPLEFRETGGETEMPFSIIMFRCLHPAVWTFAVFDQRPSPIIQIGASRSGQTSRRSTSEKWLGLAWNRESRVAYWIWIRRELTTEVGQVHCLLKSFLRHRSSPFTANFPPRSRIEWSLQFVHMHAHVN